ncbi:MAG: DUF1007 family protein [Spirochaetales bacterium]|nr:DUF1007 family protein [Spirochaetales bacterium]
MKKALALLGFSLLSLLPLCAHPHLFITTDCSLHFEQGVLDGLWVEFEFDEYFSSEILMSYDADGDRFFNEAETEGVYNNAFINLENYNFFTFLRRGEEFLYPTEAEHFSLRCGEDGKLTYRFFLPLPDYPHRDFYISLYDPTFFCDVRFQEEFFSVEGTDAPEYDYTVAQNDNLSVHYNPQGASDDSTTYDSWSQGLLTYIPKEIHVHF